MKNEEMVDWIVQQPLETVKSVLESRLLMRRVLFFHAPWCKPCIFYEKQFIQPLEARAGPGHITRVDVQNDPFSADKYLVDKLPAVVLLDGETVVMQRTGAIDTVKVARWLGGGDHID